MEIEVSGDHFGQYQREYGNAEEDELIEELLFGYREQQQSEPV